MDTVYEKGGYGVKNVKTFKGHDGIGVNCDITFNGKTIGTGYDDARGGGFEYHFKDHEADKAIMAYVKTLPPWKSTLMGKEHTFDTDLDAFINFLVNEVLEAREKKSAENKKKRDMQKYTLFTIPNDKPDILYRTVKAPYSEKVKAWLLAKYPNATILNEQ